MKPLKELIRLNKQIRVIGFDDAPFDRTRGSQVNVSGIICSGTRMEGMLWCEATKDGLDATSALANALTTSKFYDQLHAILIDGIAIGGFNIIDLPELHRITRKPCIAVMRKLPDLRAIKDALNNFDDGIERWHRIERAGNIHQHFSELHNCDFTFQIAGCDADDAATVLEKATFTGNVPEALRLAHLIGAAVKTGQSGNSA